ncbi:mediator of RNA polymerase II transcription subunit 13 [Lithohypha guttulata]|uniref:Mediator of RNA polymerase II transcription subunit 13 n=1 Tax=Lithohypha guttulata TaxID=1690604 RepID=A0ABR0KIP7_9EURO|nr:mediator of RNA polymerase II transcription subunit 13 [Lithohypha guttulata]
MAIHNEFPGNLSTNTYILHDFSEIAYIVCSAAISAALDKNSNIQNVNPKSRMLERLRNAEKQFRQASIMVCLDPKKLELFTFYKKIDIMKDQKSVLTKFGHVCKLNHCIIAQKGACRVLDLLKPEMARTYELFSAAVISNLRLRAYDGSKAINAGLGIYLMPSRPLISEDTWPTQAPQTKWHLQKLELQVVPSGQLLLAVRNANWPPVTAMPDLIDLDILPADLADGLTLYLAPTGQLARYCGEWATSLSLEQAVLTEQHTNIKGLRHRMRWMEKVQAWLSKRSVDPPISFGPGTIWLQAEIPVLSQLDTDNSATRSIEWRTIYWPVVLSYAFLNSRQSNEEVAFDVGPNDPLVIAQEWYLNGAADAQSADTAVKNQMNNDLVHENGQLFDDEFQVGSPQQFMSFPMQAFAQAQTVYPTPPDFMNAQPTPGFSVNGAAQTPVTTQQTPAAYHSSPLATTTDAGGAPVQQSAIANFLTHNENDDLFDDMEDDEIDQQSLAHEPNWDFFNVGNVEAESKYEPEEQTADQVPKGDIDAVEPAGVAMQEIESSEAFAADQLSVVANRPDEGRVSGKNNATSEEQQQLAAPVSQNGVESTSTAAPKKTTSDANPKSNSASADTSSPSAKRRRSSAYDVASPKENMRDSKYAPHGKYWFELKKPATTIESYPAPMPSYRRTSSSDDSSCSSQSSSTFDEEHAEGPALGSWTQYNPVSPAATAQQPNAVDDLDSAEFDVEVDALLKVIAAATGLEPFTTPVPVRGNPHVQGQDDAERRSMVIQLLSEQLTQSSLLKNFQSMQLPRPNQTAVFDVAVDNAGSSTSLNAASISELVAIQPANPHAKTRSKISTMEHGKLRLRQADSDIAADFSITNYWESLNLQPLSGDKDILALCIHPEGLNYVQGCDTFLQRMSETYGACNLGVHRRNSLKGVTATGLVAWNTLVDLPSVCQKVGKALASADGEEDCTVVYVIIPGDDLTSCLRLCDAFVEIYEALDHDSHLDMGDVVLQLLPSSFVVSSDTLVIPPEAQYVNLALEVYQRVPPLNDRPNSALCAPAMLLEEPAARDIHFEMTSKMVSPLARYGQCCHLAYCFSSDQKWLAATWSDATGNVALSISYCLFDETRDTKRSRSDVVEHMSRTSTHLMNRQRSKWWLAVVKVGMFETEELQEWHFVSSQLSEEQNTLSRTVLLTVELQSHLSLQGSSSSSRQFQTSNVYGPNTLSTPVSTPQAINTTSPEQAVPATPTTMSGFAASAQTPPEHSAEAGGDNETYLANPLEDSWMATLAFGLKQSCDLFETRPALASGFLLKKAAPQGNAGARMAILSVNLISVPRRPASPISLQEREHILQDILTQYRGLHTLAVARHCLDSQDGCVPWHIATAYKGANVLERFA